MTNNLLQSLSVAPTISYPGSTDGMMPRRFSYASVAAGNTTASQSNPASTSHPQPVNLHTPAWPNPFGIYPPSQGSPRPHQSMPDSDNMTDGAVNIPESWGRAGNIPSHSSPQLFNDTYGLSNRGNIQNGEIFKPTYLRGSRYMEKLEAAHRAKIAAQRDAHTHSSHPGSLSTSSSSVSLHKLAPSHRGMTYEIKEHQPPLEDDGLMQLPSRWADADRCRGLEIAADGLDIRYQGPSKVHEHEAAAARADHPMPPQCGLYYYEVTIIANGKEGLIGVGFSGHKVSLERLPGWEPDSWAYHGDDGKSFCGQTIGKSYGSTFATGDIVGCGVNFMTGCAFFTKNGVFQGNAFRDLSDVKLYPSVGMKRAGAQLSANFGQKPFVFDINEMVAREKNAISHEISVTSIAALQPPLDEKALLKELVAQYLAHDGYVGTARAFSEEINAESRALLGSSAVLPKNTLFEDDLDASNRQQIRAAILDGDIDKALKRTNAYYSHVLQDNPQIYFRLRCRKFVEIMRQAAEVLDKSTTQKPKFANGDSSATEHDRFEPDMDIDEQLNGNDDWDKMETEEADDGLKYQTLTENALLYAQELDTEFKNDRNTDVKDELENIFAMFCYADPRKSPDKIAHLLDRAGRAPVAEELNSAILVSLGKSSSAAIERLCQQTEILVSDISEDGGPGAFIHVRNDYIK